ncbi:MAG: radical SAM protein [Candidatus Poseidoniales archaeon]|nr:radical SAM protein [Candidatus Poseidoniales archaeon]
MIKPKDKPKKLQHMSAPWRITLDTNPDDCNLNCVMCEEHSPYSPSHQARIKGEKPYRRMEIETIEKVFAECAGNGLQEIIPSTMGEPLIFKHMPRIIELCHEHGIKLNLTTNGTFPRLGAKKWAELIVPVGSDVKLSWNGATPSAQSLVMINNDFEKNMEDLRTFVKIRDEHAASGGNYCSVTLQITFMEMNLRQIPRVIELAIREGVDRVKGHHLWAHFAEIKEQDMRRSREAITRWNIIARECIEIANLNPLPNGKRITLANIYELDPEHQGELHPAATCPFLGQEAWVNHEGRFDPCCSPDEMRKTLGYFGNVKDEGLLPIWQSKEYSNLLQNYLENDVCRKCNMRQIPE